MERTRLSSPALYRVAALQSICNLCYALVVDEGIHFELARKLQELAEELRTQVIPPVVPES